MSASSTDTLVFFSSQLPSELTVPGELKVVAPHFQRVVYVPSVIREGADPEVFPDNVEVVDLARGATRHGGGTSVLRAAALALKAACHRGNLLSYATHARTYAAIARRQENLARVLESFVRQRRLHDAVFYDYWFENSTLALAILKKKGVIGRAVARAHGFDVYDERGPRWRVPYREFKAEQLDRIVCVSEDGAAYMRRRLPRASAHKVVVGHLGVENQEVGPDPDGPPVVVSASHMKDFKQVHRIPDVLACVKTPLKWVHFGDGPTMVDARRKAESLPSHVQWEFRGNRPREDVLRLFREEGANLFLSLSASEGLPISMMEAASFGVPVVANGVGGIPELVNEKTGRLLDPSWPPARMAEVVERALVPGTFSRTDIAAYQRDHFNMSRNYESFANLLTSL